MTNPSTAPRDDNLIPLPLVATAITSGNKANSSTSVPVALVSSSTPCRAVEITAFADNADTISIGDSGAVAEPTSGGSKAGKGRQIAKGNSVVFNVADAELLYLAVASAADGVSYNIYS
ncbi:MAG: hypothetical protein KGI72_05410 [Patescibacteria group bacterium]|nr:hypothetical protein [Patescibacteria group bacterium]MDE2233098.1 hypothetical protein [Patescibacteria group bacterium]